MNDYWRKKTVKPNQNVDYFTSSDALKELGFRHIGRKEVYDPTETRFDKYEIRDCYEKNGQQYCYDGMRNTKTTIHEIYLRNI